MQAITEVSLLIGNSLAREGLRHILIAEGFSVSGFASSERANNASNHIVILDDDACNGDFRSTCEQIKQSHADAKLVLLSHTYSFEAVQRAFACGVDGYICQEIACEPLIKSLRLIAMGQKVLPSQVAGQLGGLGENVEVGGGKQDATIASFTEREVQILSLLVLGLANKEISRQLDITEPTVKVHVKAVLRKLKVENRTQAAIWAIGHGFSNSHRPLQICRDISNPAA